MNHELKNKKNNVKNQNESPLLKGGGARKYNVAAVISHYPRVTGDCAPPPHYLIFSDFKFQTSDFQLAISRINSRNLQRRIRFRNPPSP